MTGNAAAVAYITEFKLLWLAATYTHRRITTRDDHSSLVQPLCPRSIARQRQVWTSMARRRRKRTRAGQLLKRLVLLSGSG